MENNQSQENKIPVPSARKKISFKNDDILLWACDIVLAPNP